VCQPSILLNHLSHTPLVSRRFSNLTWLSVSHNSCLGCMIIVFDLMSDAKIQLISHQHEVHALAFSPVGAGNSPNGGDYLISIDYSRNESQDSESQSVMCLWNWQKGHCLQELQVP
jgi:hypothetical protein